MSRELNEKLQSHFDITSFEADDLMEYMNDLTTHYDKLARAFTTKRFV